MRLCSREVLTVMQMLQFPQATIASTGEDMNYTAVVLFAGGCAVYADVMEETKRGVSKFYCGSLPSEPGEYI